jgi:hypothetical protein
MTRGEPHVSIPSRRLRAVAHFVRGRLAAVGLASALAACSTAPPLPSPIPMTPEIVGTFTGTWTGVWGGTSATLVIVEQRAVTTSSGVYLGPVQVLGQPLPGVSGVLTSTIGGAPKAVTVQGWLGSSGGRAALVLGAVTVDGRQYLNLVRTDDGRLAGTGHSDFPWGPQGTVLLVHEAGPPGPPR